jgi:hypothetical protein
MALRETLGRDASPTAAIIDSQSLKAAATYGPPRRQVVSVVQPERSAQTYPAFRYEPLAKMEIRAFWSS